MGRSLAWLEGEAGRRVPQSQRVKRGSVFYGPADHNAGSGPYSESGRKPQGSFVLAGEALELPHWKNHSHCTEEQSAAGKAQEQKGRPGGRCGDLGKSGRSRGPGRGSGGGAWVLDACGGRVNRIC